MGRLMRVRPIEPTDHNRCACWLQRKAAEIGMDVHVSTEPPIVCGPYPIQRLVCPHGQRFYYEPTGEQLARWAEDGAP